ncbi:MAG: hypothetical protein E7202_03540 [Selenomonas ruminantium]|jgi:glycine cleavage system aminomethyltransferase T|nr:hypothetical protein [Selenomonas ruminantium]
MLKKVLVSLFVLGGLFLGIIGTEKIVTPIAQASGAMVYHDSDFLVTVEKVYRKSDANIDTDVTFMIHSEFSVKETHYEFLKKDGTWLFRTHLVTYGHWAPVSRDNIAQAIFDYAYYNS